MPHHHLLGLLEELSNEEFEKFQWSLRYNSDGKVTKAQLVGANRMTTVDVMIQTYTADGAVKITKMLLKKIHRNDLAGKRPDTGSGPGSAKQKTGYKLAKKPALKEPVVKDCKKATKQTTTSTNKAPAKKKAQPKEAKPRKAISKNKMDLKTAPEGPREPHEKPHPKVLSATDKRGRKRKDPNAPKQPPSAFFLFCSEHLKQIHPGLSLGAGGHSKILEEMWSKVSQSDKQPYEKKAQELREKYDTDMVAYREISQGGDEDDDEDGDDEDNNCIVSAEHDYFGGSRPKEFGNPWSKQGPKTSDLCFQHSPAIAPCPSNIFYVPPPGGRYVTPPVTVTPMLACPSASDIWSRGADSKSQKKTSVGSYWFTDLCAHPAPRPSSSPNVQPRALTSQHLERHPLHCFWLGK